LVKTNRFRLFCGGGGLGRTMLFTEKIRGPGSNLVFTDLGGKKKIEKKYKNRAYSIHAPKLRKGRAW